LFRLSLAPYFFFFTCLCPWFFVPPLTGTHSFLVVTFRYMICVLLFQILNDLYILKCFTRFCLIFFSW
jgi:hypothetical protein